MSITLPHHSIPGNAVIPRRPAHIHIPRRAGPRQGASDRFRIAPGSGTMPL